VGGSGRGVAERVLDQVRHQLRQQIRVADHRHSGLDPAADNPALLLGRGLENVGNHADQRAQIDPGEALAPLPASTWAMRSSELKMASSRSTSAIARSVDRS
jgi:hypothetical protein